LHSATLVLSTLKVIQGPPVMLRRLEACLMCRLLALPHGLRENRGKVSSCEGNTEKKSFRRSKKIKWISSNDSFKPLTTAHVCAVFKRHLIRMNTQSGATNAERYFLDVEDVWDNSCRSTHSNFDNGRRHWSALLWPCVFSGFHRDVDQFYALLGYYVAYLLSTPCSRVLLEKLTGFQLVQKFPACYETRRFITAHASDRHLPYPEPARSSPHPHILLPEDLS